MSSTSPNVPTDVPSWAVASAVNAAVSRVIRIHECIADGQLDDAQIIAEGIELDLNRWLREAREDQFRR
jgi:hypothetical protein